MEQVTKSVLENFLQMLGERLDVPTPFYLIGGSALILLGSVRETIDIDYFLKENKDKAQSIIKELSSELKLDLEYVPLGEFIPLPQNAEERHQLVAKHGKIEVYIFDPYSIALSKLDRGFETDIEDIVFLIHQGLVSLAQLEQVVKDALAQAGKYDLNPNDMKNHLQAVYDSLK